MAKNDTTLDELGTADATAPEVPTAPAAEASVPPVPDAPPAAEVTAPTPEVPAVDAPAVETVTVTVPAAFDLVIDHATTISVKPGVQEMALEHANHWYAIASGVVIYKA